MQQRLDPQLQSLFWLAALRNFVRDTALQADHLGQHNLSTSCKGELL
jgi:hypothetical protein